ncbi:MAG TPA: TonB C-terminal domain-containing protein [Verrucomicrobiae bacterium]|jgi:TonB family protein|nr:TonB C-terminal domain-containing protein [Verrucomicrobiae bacterium]
MNRLQKKCFVFAVGMHVLLAVILIVSAAFRNRPNDTEAPVLSLIPANILDQAGVGGGEQPAATVRVAQPQPPSQPQPQAQPRQEVQPVAQPVVARRVERPKPQEEEVETRTMAFSENPLPRPTKTHRHEVHPTFTSTVRPTHTSRQTAETSEAASEVSAARAQARRRKEIESAFDNLASNVRTSGAGKTIVDTPGIGGGGESFAGYRDVVRSYYYRAWIAPENGGDKSASPVARIVVSRDGSILSAELISPSGDSTLDRSISRVLRDVTKLPPFPAGSPDDQKVFRLQFSLDLKESSG